MNRMAECSNGDCLYPFLISDTTIDITIRTSSRPPNRGLATTNYTELDGHDGMTIGCIYKAALRELALGSGWRPDEFAYRRMGQADNRTDYINKSKPYQQYELMMTLLALVCSTGGCQPQFF